MNDELREKIEGRVKDLPTLPSIAAQIFNVTNNPESSVDDLSEVIGMDQVVAGRILKAVNSAYYGFPRKIDTLSKAIVILGFNNVRSIALSVSVMDLFSGASPTKFNYSELWKHALGTAHCMRALARKHDPRSIEQYFVAGLLHDIGFIAMNHCFKEDFMNAVNSAIQQNRPFYEVEVEKFEFDHTDVGRFVADKWLLPGTLSQAIGLHHRPHEAEENIDIIYAVHVADIICKTKDYGDYGDNKTFTWKSIYKPAAEMFGISEEGPADELAGLIDEDLAEASDFLSVFDKKH
ncbi:MAG TPA: HDOD domain-containing protein [bacterium]|nr:HDOD domain-containing protein [bacterium]